MNWTESGFFLLFNCWLPELIRSSKFQLNFCRDVRSDFNKVNLCQVFRLYQDWESQFRAKLIMDLQADLQLFWKSYQTQNKREFLSLNSLWKQNVKRLDINKLTPCAIAVQHVYLTVVTARAATSWDVKPREPTQSLSISVILHLFPRA